MSHRFDPGRLDPDAPDTPAILAAHDAACARGDEGYLDPRSGLFVFTENHHLARGHCCDSGCRHCPYWNSAAAQ